MKDDIEEFTCHICHHRLPIEQKGNAVDSKNKSIDVCEYCCAEEQKRQFLCNL